MVSPFSLLSILLAVSDVQDSTASGVVGMMLALWGSLVAVIWGFYCLIFLASFAFLIAWVWLLIDCIQRKNFDQENDRLIWALVLLFTGFIGAVLYYFLIKRKKDVAAPAPPGKPTAAK